MSDWAVTRERLATNPYLEFVDVTPPGRITLVVEVRSARGAYLGSLKWYGAWRQYCFFPAPDCIFNVGCLDTIKRNTQVMNDVRKGR